LSHRTIRSRTYELLEAGQPGDGLVRLIRLGLALLIVVNVVAVVLESVPVYY
jgi:hypothetical protein